MSVFLSPSTERNLCFMVDKLDLGDSEDGEKSEEKIKIWVSKELLAVASPVFNKMFYGDFRENQMSSAMEPIYLPGKNDKDFIEFLDCLFPYPTQSNIDSLNVDTIMCLANEYQVEILMKKCDELYVKFIRSLPVGSQLVLVYLPIILRYKLKSALKTCIPKVAALDMRVLDRSSTMPLLDEFHQFYAAVYEAKLRSDRTNYVDNLILEKCSSLLPLFDVFKPYSRM
uniref:BTB domain-containing protein n=1 Tax=Romanomermis culicivorax TaxID=13658 RepID=A0A915J144_ROMCU